MKLVHDICSLDYLVGTLSTAYKGGITSLAMKDFCMTEEKKSVTLTGTVLSMPPGDYNASLLQQGVEFARTPLEHGSFVLKTDSDRVKQARELQIDIIQNGRHIGTFLLKKEGGGGIYISAIELSEELRGMDLKLLTLPLRDKVGLLQKAEGIITNVLSTKKDWAGFSEKLDDFTRDFFWAERTAFYHAFRILAHFSLKAAERTDTNVTSKPISNFLGSIELPLQYGTGDDMLRSAVDAWLEQLEASSIRLSAQLRKSVSVLAWIHERFPEADIGPVLADILRDIREKLLGMPGLSSELLVRLQNAIGEEEYGKLSVFDRKARANLLDDLSGAEQALKHGMPGEVLTFLAAFDPDLLDPARMTIRFYEKIARNISAVSADALSAALIEASKLLFVLPSLSVQDVKSNIVSIIEKLIAAGREDLCTSLLDSIGRAGSPLKEEIIMDAALAGTLLGSENTELMDWYTAVLTSITIPAPNVRELSAETWAEIANPLHLERLTKFMDILQLGDDRLYPVLVHAVANLYISGVFIPDDRLFQRRISAYLNSPAMMGPFLLNFLLLQKLPVYFNEVGAVSTIRDYSTEIDSWADDPVLYFLRKQVHVNASNYNVRLIEKIIESWVFNDASILSNSVPPDVYAGLKPELFERYSRSIRPFFESLGVLDPNGLHIDTLLQIPEERFKPRARYGQIDEIPSKVILLCRLYQEIVKKYSLTGRDHSRKDPASALRDDLGRLRGFAQAILAPGKTTPRESLYFKRHIAFGIPSVLGTYHEAKFDALGDFFRCDAGIRNSLEKLAAAMDAPAEKATKAAAERPLRILPDTSELLALHGLDNIRIKEFAAVIAENRLYLTQVSDVLRMWQKELAWMVSFFSRTFQKPISDILTDFPKEDLPEHLMRLDRAAPDFTNKAADIIIRNMIADVTGLMETDRMIERLLSAFQTRIESTGDGRINEDFAENARPYFDMYDMTDEEAMKLSPLLGTKAKNLVYLHNRGFRVPAGVVLSPKWIEQFSEPSNAAEFDAILHNAVGILENRTGLIFGDPEKPLLLSVRSGSYVSMPGILETILYCGMNSQTVQGLIKATGDPRLAWDSYRRFIEHYATSVLGLDIGVFDQIKNQLLNELGGLPDIEALDAGDMEALVHRYHREIARAGKSVPGDAYEQLNASIRAIAASWYSRRAAQFRKATKTSERWDTSVTLMQMIPGNAAGSGATVFFTRNPFSLEQGIYGETREAATGDDLVYGRHLNRPLSKKQTIRRKDAAPPIRSLEETDPELFELHRSLAEDIEAAMGGLPQEVEATYARQPGGKREVFVLQARRMELTIGSAATFDEICAMETRVIGRGTGAHGGALSGVASFVRSPDEAARIERESRMPVILLRATASTDDIPLMTVVRGMVTSAGGVTSHAAVLAQKFDINAVVGCSGMSISTDERGEPYAVLDNTTIREGSFISIDGSSGLVFSGLCLNVSKS